jgi:DNA-binding transcriptional MerR regulator
MNVTRMTTMESRPELITAPEVMDLLRIKSRQTLARYEAEGLPFHQIRTRGRKLYDPTEVRAWIIESRWSAPAEGETA